MAIIRIDGHKLRKAIIAGANELEREKDYIDSLNVFPVPDGDTGINMSLTAIAAAKEVEKLDTANIYEVAKAASNGSLRGARGNSGVILSQLFRGFAKGLENKEDATAEDLANAFVQGAATAYKAVMKPKEGTILTVSKAFALSCAEGVMDVENADIEPMLENALKDAFISLDKTTEMLPELKQANVVDAGAYGFLKIIEGGFASRNVSGEIELNTISASKQVESSYTTGATPVDIKFIYCTEFIIDNAQVTPSTENSLKKYLGSMGDSVVVVVDDDIVKVHVHTNNPGLVMERALTVGDLDNIKIENMRSQHTESVHFNSAPAASPTPEPSLEHKANAFIAVASGDGLSETFYELGADLVVSGGQSMNPSTEDILDAVNKLNADNIFVLPNNKNIVLAAEQAAILSEKNVNIVPSKTIPQGITALISFMPEATAGENMKSMKEALGTVKTGMVTYAVRASSFDGMDISDGDVLGLIEDKIDLVAKDVMEGAKRVIDKLFEDGEGDVLSIYYGDAVSEDEAMELAAYVEETYPSCESVCAWGGQPIYHYVLSLE